MIRQHLQYIQEQINGTIYFPPCSNPDTPHRSRDSQQQQQQQQQRYDAVATGWIKQHPIVTSAATATSLSMSEGMTDPTAYNHCDVNYNYNNRNNSNPIGIVIIQVQNEYDVQVVVPILAHLYQTYHFPFRIRSGGHHKAGYSSLTDVRNRHATTTNTKQTDHEYGDGAVLCLSLLNHLRLIPSSSLLPGSNDAGSRTAIPQNPLPPPLDEYTSMVIEPAVRVQDVLQQVTRPYQYGSVIGFCNQVAEGGFVLGGGFGVQSRMHGLGLDNVVSFRIVLYNGTAMTTSSIENSDLHWALLGAGSGSYGVITEMEYKIHPVSDILHILQIKFHDLSKLAHFLFEIGSIESTLPDNVVLMYDALNAVSLWWTGSNDADVQEGPEVLHSLVESILGSGSNKDSVDTELATIRWTDTFDATNSSKQTSENTDYGDWGTAAWAAACWTGFLFPENNTIDVWNDIVQQIDLGLVSSQPYLFPDIELWGGDISRRASNATAFPYREAVYNVGILLIIPLHEPNGTDILERESQKINDWWHKVDQYLTGSYVNYPSVSLLDHTDPQYYAKMLWGDNLPRLVKIKQQFDPHNVFQFPMSVPNSIF
jgi:FAD/FMN-containing dehydrogenase